MIRLIEAFNFRCLRYIRQTLDPFHVLIGPNACGKTTFLDVMGFLGRMVSEGLESAIADRTENFQDLVWGRAGKYFELAIEASIPDECKVHLKKEWDTIRYEVRIGQLFDGDEVGIIEEKALLKKWADQEAGERLLFPIEPQPLDTILTTKSKTGERTILSKTLGGNDNFYSEVMEEAGKGWFPSIRLGPRKSALATLPEDETRFPVSTWLKRLLAEGIQNFMFNSLLIRKASKPGQRKSLNIDGSNLPWVIHELERPENKKYFDWWIEHLQTALDDLSTIRTVERPDDKHRYLVLHYKGGLEVPSWMASDGTLRLLALTIIAYLPDFKGITLIEEPENGIHPRAVETMFKSLSSVYKAQVLLATHSPIILSVADVAKVLCFKKTASGATDIIRGDQHPALRHWKGEVNLGTLFAGGVLG